MEPNRDGQRDQRLVRECMAGDAAAWRRLYASYYARLVAYAGAVLRREGRRDANLADEMAERVFVALLIGPRPLLEQYDPAQAPLWEYLKALGRRRLRALLRDRHERQARMTPLPSPPLPDPRADTVPLQTLVEELRVQLPPRQQEFLQAYADTGLGDKVPGFTDSAAWKMKERIEQRARSFMQGERGGAQIACQR